MKKMLIYEEYSSVRSSGSRDRRYPSSACFSRPNNMTETDIKITAVFPVWASDFDEHKTTQLIYGFWSVWLIKTDFYAFYFVHCHARDTNNCCICVAFMQIFNNISRCSCRYKAFKS